MPKTSAAQSSARIAIAGADRGAGRAETSSPSPTTGRDVRGAQALSRPDLELKLQAVQKAKERLRFQQNPLQIGVKERESVAVNSSTPTTEREFKSGSGLADVVLREPSGRYVTTRRERSAIEAHSKAFSEDEMFIAAQFVRDAERATSVNITAAYDGAPRQVSGPRAGGVSDRDRVAHARFMEMWSAMSEPYRHVAKWLVLEVRRENTGSTASAYDIGTEMTGIRDKATARGVGVGLLKATLWRIAELYRKQR